MLYITVNLFDALLNHIEGRDDLAPVGSAHDATPTWPAGGSPRPPRAAEGTRQEHDQQYSLLYWCYCHPALSEVETDIPCHISVGTGRDGCSFELSTSVARLGVGWEGGGFPVHPDSFEAPQTRQNLLQIEFFRLTVWYSINVASHSTWQKICSIQLI